MTSMWWTLILQPNQTRLWEDDVIGHVWGIGHVCESYIYIYIYIKLSNTTLYISVNRSFPHYQFDSKII